MSRRRPDPKRLVALVLLSLLAQALLPRSSWYAHRHAGAGHGHVHEWDGTRVAGSSASLRDLLPPRHQRGHQHDHAYGDPADSTHGHRHDHPGTHHHGRADAHDHAHGASAVAATHTPHHGDEVRPATARDADDERGHAADGPGFVASRDEAHAHEQAPFQTALAAHVPGIAAPRPHRPISAANHPSPLLAPGHALRARAPPHSPV